MGFWTDFVEAGKGAVGDFASSAGDYLTSKEGLTELGKLGLGYIADKSGIISPQKAPVGYQGKVPELSAVRERVPMESQAESGRVPGSAGRRYFSDTQYAQRPSGGAPTVEQARAIAQQQAAALAGQNQTGANSQNVDPAYGANPNANPYVNPDINPDINPNIGLAAGGIASAYNRPHNGYYLGGVTDGMADEVRANIDGTQEARLSDGEFVIPADVVSHLGNGNSDAGANQLHSMMSSVRKERTGNPEQGKQIDPNRFMPNMASGGAVGYNYGGAIRKFSGVTGSEVTGDTGVATGTTDAFKPQDLGTESSLSNWAGDYVTNMLGKGQALGEQGYQAYQGPLTAGSSNLQNQAFAGIGALQAPQGMGTYTPQTFGAEQAKQGMNPYLMAALNPQLEEARRQSEIDRIANAGRMTQSGAFGGSRQALMDMENQRNLQTNLADITGQGYASAYDRAREQFNTEQNRGMEAQAATNQYGFDVLGGYAKAGDTQRGIASEGIEADYAQFKEERDFPYKQVQYMQSLLQGMPLEAQSTTYSEPSKLSNILEGSEGLSQLWSDYISKIGGGA
jgi:hypothetical protein